MGRWPREWLVGQSITTAIFATRVRVHSPRAKGSIEALLARSVVVQRVGALLERFLQSLRLRFELLRGCLGAAQAIVDCHRLDQSWAADTFQDEFTYREWDIVGSCLCVLAIHKGMLHAAAGIAETVRSARPQPATAEFPRPSPRFPTGRRGCRHPARPVDVASQPASGRSEEPVLPARRHPV